MILRPYQTEAVDSILTELETKNSALLVLPTGCGKTEVMFSLCSQLVGKVLIVSHKVNLVEQTAKRALKSGKKVSIYCKSLNKTEISDITIASVQSINAVPDMQFDYILVDEAHRLAPKNQESFYKSLIDKMPNVKIIGVTATPYRVGGYIYGDVNSWFKKVVYSRPMKEMIEAGYLVKPRLKRTENEFNTKGLRVVAGDYAKDELEELVSDEDLIKLQVGDALKKLEGRNKVAWACTSIKHAELVQSLVHNSSIIHSKLHKQEQARNMMGFELGSTQHMMFVSMLSEGYDFPAIDALVFMRPTRSPVLYVQTVGRVLRPFKDKQDALILDYGQVVKNLGPVDNPQINTTKRAKTIPAGKFCEACLDYNESKNKICTGCGEEFKAPPRDPFKQMTQSTDKTGEILSGDGGSNWIHISRMVMSPKIAMSGRSMIEISYYERNKLFPIREYLVFGEHWMNEKSLLKLKKFGIEATSYQDAVRKLSFRTKKVTAIKVKMNGKFPEVADAIYE